MGTKKYCVLLLLLYSIPVTATATVFGTVFHTNCTRPSSSSFNFVTAPNTRGTLEILWSCFFTLFICTWQVQHPNVPPLGTSSVSRFWAKLYSMLFTLLAPEALLGVAVEEFLAAQASVSYMHHELPELVKQGGWTMAHAFYAHMYGFVVRRRTTAEPNLVTPPVPMSTSEFQPFIVRQSDSLVLNTERMVTYLKSLPSPKAFITEVDIERQAKGDIFLKCIAGFQVVWFIAQVCARRGLNLPTSQLETAVLGFAFCTLTSYLFWRKKPQNVSVPTFLDEGPDLLPISDDWFDSRDKYFTNPYHSTSEKLRGLDNPLALEFRAYTTGLTVVGFAFGAIHLLAWNLHFPTHTERILWRTSSIATTTIPPLFLPLRSLGHENNIVGAIVLLVYFVCRLFLVVESFRSFWYLPGGAFVATWSTYMPHVM